MRMNRHSIYLIILVLSLGLFSCKEKPSATLRIGTNAEYPPFEYREGDSFKGVDIDLAARIAEKLGMQYQLVDMEFETLLPALNAGKIDMAISAITITDERARIVDFSPPYYVANQVIIAPKGSTLILDRIEDVAHYKIGTQSGTTGMDYLMDNFVQKKLMPKDHLSVYSTNMEAISAMLDGEIDFVIIDDSAARGYSAKMPVSIALKIHTNENYGIAMPKKAPLNPKIVEALQDLIDSQEVLSIIQKHIK